MFSRTYIFLLLSFVLLGSCQNNQEGLSPGDQPVVFTPAICGEGTLTRASNNSWHANDRVGIYMIPHVESGSADLSTATAEATNIEYKIVNAGTSSDLVAAGNFLLYPQDNSEVNFVAYYPFNPDVHNVHNHTYPVNVSTQDPLTDIDLLHHDGSGTPYKRSTGGTVPLEFTHQLSKLIIAIKPAPDVNVDLLNAGVSLIGFPTENSFNLSNSSLGTPSNPSTTAVPILPVVDEDQSSATELFCEAILIPCSGSDFTRSINVTIDGYSYIYTFPADLDFKKGEAYSYHFTFTGRAVLFAGATIVDWNTLTESGKIGEGFPADLRDKIDWSKPIVFDGESNSYIVPPSGQLLIPISRAKTYHDDYNNTHPVLEKDEAFYVKLYWSDTAGLLTEADITPIGTGPNGYLLVKPGANSGNALIAVRKKTGPGNTESDYTTLWSWHVWVTDYNPNSSDVTFTNTYNTNNNGDHFVFMDRNLGAIAAGYGNLASGYNYGTGLFYQWGRKDPFPATLGPGDLQPGGGSFTAIPTDATVGTIANTIKNPSVFYGNNSTPDHDWLYVARDNTLWGNGTSKSIYDPCPAGWRIPSHKDGSPSDANTPWAGFEITNGGTYSYGYSWGTNAIYPAAGYRHLDAAALEDVGLLGAYWGGSPYSINCSALYFDDSQVMNNSRGYRANGYSVRCVQE